MCVFSSVQDSNSKESSTTVRHRRYETRTSTTEQQRGQNTRHHRGVSSVRCRMQDKEEKILLTEREDQN